MKEGFGFTSEGLDRFSDLYCGLDEVAGFWEGFADSLPALRRRISEGSLKSPHRLRTIMILFLKANHEATLPELSSCQPEVNQRAIATYLDVLHARGLVDREIKQTKKRWGRPVSGGKETVGRPPYTYFVKSSLFKKSPNWPADCQMLEFSLSDSEAFLSTLALRRIVIRICSATLRIIQELPASAEALQVIPEVREFFARHGLGPDKPPWLDEVSRIKPENMAGAIIASMISELSSKDNALS